MTGATKILTVSYGTFSCTLEGFDDPFSSMQSIAEYFRDLAADDRYFGANPPTLDAAMLQRIAAQAQTGPKSGQIQTQLREDGVVLRQTGPDAAAPDAAVAPEPDTPAPAPVAAIAAVPPPAPGSVADKLSRIRAVVARSGGDLGGFTDEEPTYASAAAPNAAPLQSHTPLGSDAVNSGYQDEDEEVPSILHPPEDVAPQSAEPPQPEADPLSQPFSAASDSEASGNEQPNAEDADVNPAVAADDAAESVALSDDQDEAPMSDLAAADPAGEAEEDPTPEVAPQTTHIESDLSARIAALRGASALTDGDDAVARVENTTVEISPDDADAYDGDEEVGDDAAAMTAGGATDAASGEGLDPDVDADDFDLEDDEFHAFAKPRVTRSDVAVDRILEKTNTEMNEHEGSRRRSAIAHLKAAVAATRAGAGREPVAGQDDDTMSQFRDDLAKAVRPQQQTDGPATSGGQGQRSGIAATPLMLVPSLRVGNAGADTPQTATSAQPRRVANSDVNYDDDFVQSDATVADRFSEFVAQQDARELPEVMEAAAAYATHVEGRPHVTRPLVMSRVLEQNNSVKREDALRTFGRLLRDGRIIRLKRGKFAVAEDTRFRGSGNQ